MKTREYISIKHSLGTYFIYNEQSMKENKKTRRKLILDGENKFQATQKANLAKDAGPEDHS